MIFPVQVVNHTVPAISVVVADKGNGVGGVTYAELKQSLGQQVYDVGCLYLYSDNQNQLTGVINYNIFDSNGTADVTNIVTAVDPYQFVGSLLIPLKDKVNIPVILNGNSSVSTTVLPNTYFQVKFLADRISNKLGLLNSNFTQMESITNTQFFSDTYSESGGDGCNSGRGNLLTGQQVKKNDIVENAIPTPQTIASSKIKTPLEIKSQMNYNIFLLLASISAGMYLISKDN
jgi:hypothetical protein